MTELQPSPIHSAQDHPHRHPDRGWAGGATLIVIGIVLLLTMLDRSEILSVILLLLIGIVMITWGLMARSAAPLIPGGILTGLGIGVVLLRTVYINAIGTTQGAVILLALGLGFLAIMPLTLIIQPTTHWWPTIPGSILVVIGALLALGESGLPMLNFVGTFWPLTLIIAGILIIWRAQTKQRT